MGSLVGGLGRLQKAAAGAVLGAVALTTISSGAALAAEMPEPSLVPDHVIEQQVQSKTYTVKSGDSMWSIAKRNGVPFADLIAANPQVKDPGLIFPKQVLTLPTQAVPKPIVRPSTAENASSPAAAPAENASSPAAVPVDAAQSTAPTKPGSLGKLWREVRKLTFDLLKDQKIDQDEQFELGEFTTLGLSLKGIFKDTAGGNWDRLAFERAQDKTKDVLWLDTQGAISAASKYEGDDSSVVSKSAFSFSLLRPHVFTKKDPDALAAAKDLVAGMYKLPLKASGAAALQQGSAFTLKADAELDADGTLSFGTVKAGADADLEIEVRRRDGHTVDVSYERGVDVQVALQAKDLADGTVDASLGFEGSRELDDTYRLDLSSESGKKAYNALLSLKADRVRQMVEQGLPGVEHLRDDDGRSVEVSAALDYKPSAQLDADLQASWSSERQGDEVSTQTEGRATATIKPEDSDVSATVRAFGERTREPDERSLDVGGGIDVKKPLSESTDLRLSAEVERGHSVDDRWDRETRSGRLAHGGVLSTKLQTSTGKPWTLGFNADVEVEYELVTPKGKEVSLPLTGTQMRRAPEGTRFTLSGTGATGATAQRALQRVDLSADVKVEGDIEVTAWRQPGDAVKVRLDVERARQFNSRVRYAEDQSEPSFAASFEHKVQRGAERSATFNLSLSKPAHRRAYDALLKGDMGPALALTQQPSPEWIKQTGNSQAFKLDASLTTWFDAGLELARRDIDPSDGRVRWNKERLAFTNDALGEGKKVRWIEGEGAFAPKLSFTNSVPVGGALSLRHGFSAGQTLRYRALAPSVDGASAPLQPAMTPQDALRMPLGAEFELVGRGSVSGFGGLGLGSEWATNGVSVAASASADHKQEIGRTWQLQVRRLPAQKVEVSVDKGSDRNLTFELAARAGVQVDSEQLFGLESSVEQLALLGKVTDKLDSSLQKRLSLEFESSWSSGRSKSSAVTFELDLSKPPAREAYLDLMRLNAKGALSLGEQVADHGLTVTSLRQTEETESARHMHLDAFGERLYLTDALRKDSTSIERWKGGSTRTDRSSFREKYEGLLGREQDVHWEAVRVREQGDPVGKGYYRLRYSDEDPMTSKDELRDLLSLGKDLKAEPVRAPRIEKGARGLKKLFGNWARHGSTKIDMDLFFTADSVQSIRNYDGASALQVYGEVAARRAHDSPYGWAQPQTRDKAIALMKEYQELQADPFSDRDTQDAERSVEVAYWRLTGNEMWEDRDAYEAAEAFASMVQRMHTSDDPAQWNRAFADMGQAMSFDFYDAVATMQKMSEGEDILVHNLRMKGRAVDIEMKDEGLLRYPG